jgi:hypothetical protein
MLKINIFPGLPLKLNIKPDWVLKFNLETAVLAVKVLVRAGLLLWSRQGWHVRFYHYEIRSRFFVRF